MNDTIEKGESTIQLVGIDPLGFVLPDGYSWNPRIVNGFKEGRVSVKDKQKRIYAVLIFHHDCLNGLCSFYENGMIQKTITFVNNVANGWSCEYRNGQQNSFFWYKNGSKEFRLEQCKNRERLWKAFDINTNQLSSCCYYDSNHIIQGNGCIFENGIISKVGFFADGELVSLVKTFSQNHMKEYDDSGNVVYEGEFLDDVEKEYPREGRGSEIRNDSCIYEGYWKNNKREGKGSSFKGCSLYYLGEWENNLPNGNGKLFDCDRDSHVLYDGVWEKGLYKVNEREVFDYSTGKVREFVSNGIPSPKPVTRVSSIPRRISSSTGPRVQPLRLPRSPEPPPISSSTKPIVRLPSSSSLSSSRPVVKVPLPSSLSSSEPVVRQSSPPPISSSTKPIVQLPSSPRRISSSTEPHIPVPHRVIASSTGPVRLLSPPPSSILPSIQPPLKSRHIMPNEVSVNPELLSTPVLISEEKPLSASPPKPLVPHVQLPKESIPSSVPVPVSSSPCPQEVSTIELIESPKPLFPSEEPVKPSVPISNPSHSPSSSNNHTNNVESSDGKDLRVSFISCL